MQKVIYVTEPDVINVHEVKRQLTEDYEVFAGNISFSGVIPKGCTTLIIRSATMITASIKEKIPNLTDIIRVGVGVDNIDMDFCNNDHIAVYNAPGANADAVSDYIIGMMLVALRKVYILTEHDVESWNRFKFTGHNMSSRSIGIIGFGNIGRQIHKKLQGFDCKAFYAYDPFVKQEDFPKDVAHMSSVNAVLEKADIITLHLPLLAETHHLINKESLKLVRDDAILLNASRGGIVNEADIADVVRDRGLVYIADTVENEPRVSPALLQTENIIVTPHIASLTEESEVSMIKTALDNYLLKKAVN